jgi:hypothetical protein
MGALTDDITRLCGEIEALRDSRKVFGSQLDKDTKEMKTEVSVMRGGFRHDHKIMAGRTNADRVKFVSNLDAEVSGLLNAFDKSQAEMATKTKKANAAFVSDVANHVSGLLTGYQKDLKAMSQATKADRNKFVNQLEKNVDAMRKVNVNDLVGARAAWVSLSPEGRKSKLAAEQRTKADQERKARFEAEQRAKALEEARSRAETERSKAQAQSSAGMKKDKK